MNLGQGEWIAMYQNTIGLDVATARWSEGHCPACTKRLVSSGEWVRCPDGVYFGNPIEFQRRNGAFVYRKVG